MPGVASVSRRHSLHARWYGKTSGRTHRVIATSADLAYQDRIIGCAHGDRYYPDGPGLSVAYD